MYSASYCLFICFCVCDFRNSRETNAGGQTWGCFSITFVFTQTLLIVISSCTKQANAEGQKWVCFSIGVIQSALVLLQFRCLLLSNIKPLITKCLLSLLSSEYCSRSVSLGCCMLQCLFSLFQMTILLSTETNLVYWFSFSRARLASWWGCHILVACGGFLSPPFLKRS